MKTEISLSTKISKCKTTKSEQLNLNSNIKIRQNY